MMVEEALSYLGRGWAVVPVHSVTDDLRCSCGQVTDYQLGPIKHQTGKHPYTEHGHKDASRDPVQIALWWNKWPGANISIVTGFRSGLVVLDVDNKPGVNGHASLMHLERRYGLLPKTVKVISGGGGAHYYFRHPGFDVRGRRGMYPGLDVQADGGKIVAPPSKHKTGKKYIWAEGCSPDDVTIAPLPPWLLREIKTPKSKGFPPVKKLRLVYW